MTDNITALLAEARDMGDKRRKTWLTPREMASLIRCLADALEAENARSTKAEDLLDRVAGVAASSIPDLSLREKPMAAVVDLAATLSAAEAERDRYRAAIKEALDSLSENEDPDTVVIAILTRALNEGDTDE